MSRFQVEIVGTPSDEIPFVAALRTVGRMRLADAAAVYRHTYNTGHTVLVAGIDQETAAHIASTFRTAGIEAAVKPSSLNTPMVCFPNANVPYRWNALRNVVKVVTSHREKT